VRVSADRRTVVVASAPGAVIVDGLSGQPHPLLQMANALSISPDGQNLVAGVLAALLHRVQHPEAPGQEIDLSLTEAMMRLLEVLPIEYQQLGLVHQPVGNGNAYVSPAGMFRAGDGGWLSFTAATQNVFQRLCKLIGREDLLANPEYATTPGRAARVEEIDGMVTAWTRQRTKNEVMTILTDAHVPCAPVRTAAEVVDDPHLRARGVWQEIEHPRRGKTKVPISPIRLHGAEPSAVTRPAPLLGQDTDRVLAELCGLSADELAALHAARVIEPVKT